LLLMTREPHIRVKPLIYGVAATLLLGAGYAPRFASAESLCESCELQVGIGETYHFWGSTGGVVIPITLNWSDSRYELGLFRLSRRQILYDAHYPNGRVMADPYWGLSLSRRWRIFTRGPVKGFFGFGVSAKNESDQLSITRLDFASQLGVRFPLPGNRVLGELTLTLVEWRHSPPESRTGLCDVDVPRQLRTGRRRQNRSDDGGRRGQFQGAECRGVRQGELAVTRVGC
jgi:hypothetical protein